MGSLGLGWAAKQDPVSKTETKRARCGCVCLRPQILNGRQEDQEFRARLDYLASSDRNKQNSRKEPQTKVSSREVGSEPGP